METLTPERIRQHDDTTTWVAEVLNGNMRTPFEYTYDGKELRSHDGLPLTPVFDNAIADAEALALNNPDLYFELRRRHTEREELDDMKAMARGEGPNTMVVESDFPPELIEAIEDVGGYNVSRKQTFLRVIYRRDDGTIVMLSQTLEGSDRDGLEAIREYLGFDTHEGELLGQRMKLDLESEQQEFLIDALEGIYDRALELKHGGEYKAGWRLATRRAEVNTYDFVCQQVDLLEAYRRDMLHMGDDGMFALAAAMKSRFERMLKGKSATQNQNYTYYSPPQTPLSEMYAAALGARLKQETFSGCGKSIGREGSDNEPFNLLTQLDELGYGNRSEETEGKDEDEYGSLTFECPNGHTNRRPRGKLIDTCKTCKCSVKC